MRLIFLGAPGAGKTTQAAILASQWQIAHISTGQILRQAIARKSSLGLKAQTYVEAGELVPDNLILAIVQERLRQPDAKRGWILHGFPRNLPQAEAFDHLMKSLGQSCDQVFLFYVPLNLLLERMLKRGYPDDTTETIYRRLEIYQEQMRPLIQYYKKSKCLAVINGDRPIEAITQFMQTSLQIVALA